MKSIHSLKTLSKQAQPAYFSLQITDRLPDYIQGPCEIECDVRVQHESQYYRLYLKSVGQIQIECQRCLQGFTHFFEHTSELAICASDEIANQTLSTLDCIVHADDDLDFLDIVTDDLHLFSPQKHEMC